VSIKWNSTVPAAPAGARNVTFQGDGISPQQNGSAYVPAATKDLPGIIRLEPALDSTKVLRGDGTWGTGASLVGKGVWDIATAYAANQWVTRSGSSYIALQASTGKAPESNPTYWQLLAQAGTNGTNGTNGAPGATGATGPMGTPVLLRGAFTNAWGTAYAVNDATTFSGSLWGCIVPYVCNGTDATPDNDAGHWLMLTGGIAYAGDYSAGTAYTANQWVTWQGQSYLCILGGTGIAVNDTAHWRVMAAQGTQGASGASSRQTVTVTTASLANNATGNVLAFMAKSFSLPQVQVSAACRVRLYQTSAQRTIDASRAATSPPAAGTAHGVIFDAVINVLALQASGLAQTFPAIWPCSPVAVGTNGDTPASGNIYCAVQNLSGGTAALTVVFTFVPEES